MYTLLESSGWTSRAHRPLKICDRIFQLIPLRPRCGNTTSPEVPVVVVLTHEELSPGSPRHNTIYVMAVHPTGCCSEDIAENKIAKIMPVVRTKSVAVASSYNPSKSSELSETRE